MPDAMRGSLIRLGSLVLTWDERTGLVTCKSPAASLPAGHVSKSTFIATQREPEPTNSTFRAAITTSSPFRLSL